MQNLMEGYWVPGIEYRVQCRELREALGTQYPVLCTKRITHVCPSVSSVPLW